MTEGPRTVFVVQGGKYWEDPGNFIFCVTSTRERAEKEMQALKDANSRTKEMVERINTGDTSVTWATDVDTEAWLRDDYDYFIEEAPFLD
jgi:hypothetical protein